MSRGARLLLHTGPAAALLAWAVIATSWALNSSWFAFTRDAFSDLGGPRSCCPILYNAGLIATGALVLAYGVAAALLLLEDKPGVSGGSYLALAGVFLALIGVFPAGTRPHVFVSTWFFVQASLGYALLLYSLWRLHSCSPAGTALAATLAAWPIAVVIGATVGWPSAAVLETYGILILDAATLASWRCLLNLARRST